MAKRLIDVLASAVGLLLLSPVLLPVLAIVWLQDFHSPLYIADRVARGGGTFRMAKIRSMIVKADRSGVESTSANDPRITPIGAFVRRWKIDELSQLWNVLKGDMSLVGPRPNTVREVERYTPAERRLLTVRPGITDVASIVFSDEGAILAASADPDGDYERLIRPWKSRLGLFYVDRGTMAMDMRLIWLTALAIVNKPLAVQGVVALLQSHGADAGLCEVAARRSPLDCHLAELPQ
jgi:lipopolysaccharide/colanic/teichoic acid biosynthesis glycosyltransferase